MTKWCYYMYMHIHTHTRNHIRVRVAVFLLKKIYLRRIFLDSKILYVGHLISVSTVVYRFIGIGNDSNSNTQ